MCNQTTGLILILFIFLVSACSENQAPGRQMAIPGEALAIVNGVPITQAEIDILIQTRAAARAPIAAEQALNEMIEIELLRQKAVKQQLHTQAQIAAEMNIKSTQVLATAIIKAFAKNLIISDQDLMMEYNQYTENLSDKQYHLRHILSKSKNDAELLLEALNKGANFAELAKQRSIDATNESGGDLGWVTPTNFPEPFYDALKTTKPGNYHNEPLQTKSGWHILMVEETRDLTPASFDQVSGNLKINITNARIKSYLAELRSEADIKILTQEPTKNLDTEKQKEKNSGN